MAGRQSCLDPNDWAQAFHHIGGYTQISLFLHLSSLNSGSFPASQPCQQKFVATNLMPTRVLNLTCGKRRNFLQVNCFQTGKRSLQRGPKLHLREEEKAAFYKVPALLPDWPILCKRGIQICIALSRLVGFSRSDWLLWSPSGQYKKKMRI